MTLSSPGNKVVFTQDGLDIEMNGHLQTITSDRLPGARVLHAARMDPLDTEEMLLSSGVPADRASQLAHGDDWFVLFENGEIQRLSRDACRRQAEIAALNGWYAGQHYVESAHLPVFAKASAFEPASQPARTLARTAVLRRPEFARS